MSVSLVGQLLSSFYSLEECIDISKKMARFLGNKYFDIPFMRYHQSMCRKCEKGKVMKCEIGCSLSEKS